MTTQHHDRFSALTLGLSLVCLGLPSCTTAPVTGRRELSLVSADQEMQLGLSNFEQMKKDVPISHDPAANAMVQRVGKRIAAAASKDLPNAQWEFVVFDSKEANAFCLPGGKIGVYTGLLPIAENDAGLATVLGHEVSHAAAHHGAERMSQTMLSDAGKLLGTTMANSDPKLQAAAAMAYGVGSQVGVLLPFSRRDESEADHIGLVYMARAGYDPREALTFWQRFQAATGNSSVPSLLSTHPLTPVRIEQIKKEMPEALAAYQSSQNAVSH